MNDLTRTSTPTSILRSRLTERLAVKQKALLLDTSGSMTLQLANGTRRIDALKKVVRDLPTGPRTFCFSFSCEETHTIPEPSGDTNMDLAFFHLKSQNVTHAVLITDGEPTCSEDAALNAAQGLKLDIIYVGDDPAPPFLRRLAEYTGGAYNKTDLLEPLLLKNQIAGLLSAGRQS